MQDSVTPWKANHNDKLPVTMKTQSSLHLTLTFKSHPFTLLRAHMLDMVPPPSLIPNLRPTFLTLRAKYCV